MAAATGQQAKKPHQLQTNLAGTPAFDGHQAPGGDGGEPMTRLRLRVCLLPRVARGTCLD